MENVIEAAIKTHLLKKTEIITLLKTNEFDEALFSAADFIRKKYVGNEIHLRGIIEFSNICKQNCFYCGIRKDNLNVERYRLSEKEIITLAKAATSLGYKTIVMQSGEDAFFTTDILCTIIEKIKKLDVAITLSLGEKTFEEYKALKEAGADRYLIRIETTDKNLYKNLHPTMDFDNRIKCLEYLKELNYEVGTGCLVGLPEQTIESLADDILFFKSIDADMIGLGPFIPSNNTPLKNAKGGSFIMAKKVMALTRLLLPDINIPATTAMETIQPNGRMEALKAGANVIMPNVTKKEHKKNYEIYPGKATVNDSSEECIEGIKKKISSIGRTISTSQGFRKKASL